MEKESFESDSVAAILNENFVCVKVDREERPDVDRMYMSYVQKTTGSGGWPMSVFLTPDLEPIFGGTYFPPEDKYGRVGFKTLLKLIAQQWNEKNLSLRSEGKLKTITYFFLYLKLPLILAKQSIEFMKKVSQVKRTIPEVPAEDSWNKCFNQLSRAYEERYGGFSMAPKFPQPTIFNFLFHLYSKMKGTEQGEKCLEMCLHTLKKMAYGGIHDHVNNGFARYSVDGKWQVPHFEKMLYDQAQIAMSYCDAYVVTKDKFYSDVVHDILTYVSRDLSHELGGFYGAEDADSYPYEGAPHKQEGAFCVWEYDEIQNLLGEDDPSALEKTKGVPRADIFCYHFNVKKNGNVQPEQDPHDELKNKNVLVTFGSYEETAEKFNLSIDVLKEVLGKCLGILREARLKRPKPHTDTKIVTSWNGLMISAYAKAGFVMKEQNYIDRALKAANFIKTHLYNEKEKSLLRCCYGEKDGNIFQV